MAQPFDPAKLAISGDAAPIVESVPGGGIANFGGFSASAKGLLVHASGSRYFSDLTWFDRRGTRIATVGEPGNFSELSLSADRTRAAVTILTQQQERTVWLVDAVRGFRTPFSTGAASSSAEFSHDGRMVCFTQGRRLIRKRADGGGSEETIYEGDILGQSFSFSPDGKFLLTANANGLWIHPDPLGEPGKSKPYQLPRTSPRASHGQFSPDGRWIAFQSDETGRDEIYVTPFPGPGVQRQISTAGGSRPRWRGDGREIFFLAPDGQIAASEVSPRNGELEAGEAKFLFTPRMRRVPPYTYDVSADGQSILAITQRNTTDCLTIVQTWTALLKK